MRSRSYRGRGGDVPRFGHGTESRVDAVFVDEPYTRSLAGLKCSVFYELLHLRGVMSSSSAASFVVNIAKPFARTNSFIYSIVIKTIRSDE